MNRSFVPMLLCALLAFAASPVPAAAQDVDRPPEELWDEFELEPSATPGATPEATATPRTRGVEAPDDDGMAPGALIGLMLAAAGVGAIAARLALRRLPRGRREPRSGREPRGEREPKPVRGDPRSTPAPGARPTSAANGAGGKGRSVSAGQPEQAPAAPSGPRPAAQPLRLDAQTQPAAEPAEPADTTSGRDARRAKAEPHVPPPAETTTAPQARPAPDETTAPQARPPAET